MRKIALVSEHASPLALAGSVDSGGQNIYVANVARQLARRGCEVDVFTRRDRSFLPTVFQWQPGVRVIHVPAGPSQFLPKEQLLPLMPAFGAFLNEFLDGQTRPYDVVHANFFMSGQAALYPARNLGLPLVMTFHALGRVRRQHQRESDLFPDERFAIEDELVEESTRIVAECVQDRDDLLTLYDADSRKIDVVPCGFDPDELMPVERTQARAQLGWNRDEFAVLQLGRLVPRKGIDNVIRGIGVLKRRHALKARLYVVGGNSPSPNPIATPEIARLSELAEQEGVGDLVTFVGRRNRSALRLYYSAADVFVTTPWYEPFGITPLEAMACGTPVIGSSVGGIRSTVLDGITGFHVPPEDPEALADRLARLHRDAGLRRTFGEAGRLRANRSFTWSQVACGLMDVYERALQSERIRTGAALHAAMPLNNEVVSALR
ncbi:MAG TPA: glycosyltransferase family 1 protein [Burkholderiaceae bacterium]|nr:glycosyltransferase family 1 protein [Burkholderiaceae bacterium]